MSAAAAKRTVFAAVSLLALVAASVAGAGGGSPSDKNRVAPTEPTNLRVKEATQSTVLVEWDPSQDDVRVAGYYVYGDKGRSTVANPNEVGDVVLTPSYLVKSLGCGQSGTISVEAFDDDRNRSERVSTTVSTAPCADLQPPTTPAGFRQPATTANSAILAWDASTDNVGVVGYGVYRGLYRIASPTESAATLTGLACGSTFQFGVDAIDAAGNRSPIGTTYVQTASCADTEAPSAPTGLSVTSRTATSASLSWSPSTDNVGVAGYRVSIDGTPAMTATASSATISGLSCGTTYKISVDAFDATGNHSAATAVDAVTDACSAPRGTSDTTPPSTPTGLSVSSVTETGLSLSWNPSTDNVGVTGYDVYRNGTKVTTTSSTSSSQTGLTCGTSYTFGVVARDAAGNSSTQAQVTSSTTACAAPPSPSDTNPPSQPSNLAITGSTATSVTLAWGASTDNVGVAGYRVYVNGSLRTTSQLTVTVTGLVCDVAYGFEVEAYDAAGNRSTRASVIGSTEACPDTQPPTQPSNLVVSSRTTTSIALSWSASSDNVGVVGYGLYSGGTPVGTSGTTSGIVSGLTCGTSYTLAVDAYDAAGNRSQKATTMVSTTACPDTTPPSAPTGLAASNVTQTSLTVTWAASADNVAVAGYDVYRNSTKVATVTVTSSGQSGLSCGTSYTFGVEAYDAAGNRSQRAQLTVSTAACSTPPPPSAYLVEDFDGGLPGIWGQEPFGSVPSLINSVSNGEGGSAARLIVTPTSAGPNASSELTSLYLNANDSRIGTDRGDDTWYRVRMRFPSGKYFPTTGQWNWHLAWHNDGHTASYGSYSTELGVYTDYPVVSGQVGQNPRLAFRLAGGLSSSVIYESHTLPANSLRYDHWYDIVIRIVWGTDTDGTGRVAWWVDGTKWLDKAFPMLQRNPDGSVDHPGFGIYNYRLHDPAHTSELHFDRVAIGPSAASVGFTP